LLYIVFRVTTLSRLPSPRGPNFFDAQFHYSSMIPPNQNNITEEKMRKRWGNIVSSSKLCNVRKHPDYGSKAFLSAWSKFAICNKV
jgi:hypothetical protein